MNYDGVAGASLLMRPYSSRSREMEQRRRGPAAFALRQDQNELIGNGKRVAAELSPRSSIRALPARRRQPALVRYLGDLAEGAGRLWRSFDRRTALLRPGRHRWHVRRRVGVERWKRRRHRVQLGVRRKVGLVR